ncbi:MAG TPA: adenylosuccinate synthase [Dehalococcoidia bacterium]|nr:adenylosuccinate synthase [Dehalococcoidia bacterium]
MSVVVVVGGQWGDEGKGRIIDLLAHNVHIVARYSAGNNAGHTVVNQHGEFRLHLVPAGIFYPDKVCIIGNGLVIDPGELLTEIQELEQRGISTKNLYASDRAHVLMPYHPLIDRLDEEMRGPMAIGTTGRGVGPAFVDKVARIGIRMADLIDPVRFRRRLEFVLPYKNAVLQKLSGAEPLSLEEVYTTYSEYGRLLAPFVTDAASLVRQAIARGESVLLEGAQGALLDLDFGTYEYVTASVPSSLAAGAATGIGIGPTQISHVVGIYKAYCTRVGNGPMPSELADEMGDLLRERGWEYGATTGRPRRCGWFDAVAARYSARLNGFTGVALTKLDALDELPAIQICTGYKVGRAVCKGFPSSIPVLAKCEPLYEEMPGWQQPIEDVRSFGDLPPQARDYVRRLEELIGCPINLISVGPAREQTIMATPIF